MQIGSSALHILEKKYARLRALQTDSADDWRSELSNVLRWVVSVPILNAYLRQIFSMHDREEADLMRDLEIKIPTLCALASQLRSATPDAETEGNLPNEQRWEHFENARKRLAGTTSAGERRDCVNDIASVALAMARTDAERTAPHGIRYRIESWQRDQANSPRTALVELLSVCRALHPPPVEGVPHWTDIVPRQESIAFKAHINRDNWDRGQTDRNLAKVVEELHVLGASTLSHRIVIERFKERSTWYDKARLREVAKRGNGREDRLTLELARYLHTPGFSCS